MDLFSLVLIACVVVLTAIGAVYDTRFKKLPNRLTVPGALAALVFHLGSGAIQGGLAGMGERLLFSLGGFATGFGILFVLFLIGGGGGGDVKFMGALGAWLGASLTLKVYLVSMVFMILGTVLVFGYQFMFKGIGRTRRRFLSPRGSETRRTETAASQTEARLRRRIMPLGVPVALATWVVLAVTYLHLGQKLL